MRAMAKGRVRTGGEGRGDYGYVCEVDASEKGRKVPEVGDGRCEDLGVWSAIGQIWRPALE